MVAEVMVVMAMYIAMVAMVDNMAMYCRNRMGTDAGERLADDDGGGGDGGVDDGHNNGGDGGDNGGGGAGDDDV